MNGETELKLRTLFLLLVTCFFLPFSFLSCHGKRVKENKLTREEKGGKYSGSPFVRALRPGLSYKT